LSQSPTREHPSKTRNLVLSSFPRILITALGPIRYSSIRRPIAMFGPSLAYEPHRENRITQPASNSFNRSPKSASRRRKFPGSSWTSATSLLYPSFKFFYCWQRLCLIPQCISVEPVETLALRAVEAIAALRAEGAQARALSNWTTEASRYMLQHTVNLSLLQETSKNQTKSPLETKEFAYDLKSMDFSVLTIDRPMIYFSVRFS
jgi:hypothetical protein